MSICGLHKVVCVPWISTTFFHVSHYETNLALVTPNPRYPEPPNACRGLNVSAIEACKNVLDIDTHLVAPYNGYPVSGKTEPCLICGRRRGANRATT